MIIGLFSSFISTVNKARYDPVKGKVLIEEHLDEGSQAASQRKVALKKAIDPHHLRIKCKCAGCIDEVDGRQIL